MLKEILQEYKKEKISSSLSFILPFPFEFFFQVLIHVCYHPNLVDHDCTYIIYCGYMRQWQYFLQNLKKKEKNNNKHKTKTTNQAVPHPQCPKATKDKMISYFNLLCEGKEVQLFLLASTCLVSTCYLGNCTHSCEPPSHKEHRDAVGCGSVHLHLPLP